MFSRLGFQFFSGVLHRQSLTDEEVLVDLHRVIQADLLVEAVGLFVALLDFLIGGNLLLSTHYSASPPIRSA